MYVHVLIIYNPPLSFREPCKNSQRKAFLEEVHFMSMKKQVFKLFAPFSSIQPPYGYPCKKQYEKHVGSLKLMASSFGKKPSQRERKLVFAKNIKKRSLGSAEMLMDEILLTTSQVPTIYKAFCFQIVIAALDHHQQDVRFREGKLPLQCL